ncbi:MAG: DUF2993 domain-containing protein [Prevotellaceae bacterium]|jgi:hypothetical protein|nr:DUF2993 domain-containing protein [Prevotellaceae bacterium]
MKKISLFLSAALMMAVLVMGACKGDTPPDPEPTPDKFSGTWTSVTKGIAGSIVTNDEVVNAAIPLVLPSFLDGSSAEFIFKNNSEYEYTITFDGSQQEEPTTGTYTFTDAALFLTQTASLDAQEVTYSLIGTKLVLDIVLNPAMLQAMLDMAINQFKDDPMYGGLIPDDLKVVSGQLRVTLQKKS